MWPIFIMNSVDKTKILSARLILKWALLFYFFRHFLLVDDSGLQVYSYEVHAKIFTPASFESYAFSVPLISAMMVEITS